MKRYIQLAMDSDNQVAVIDIRLVYDHPLFHIEENDLFDDDATFEVAASSDVNKYDIPIRPVISRDKQKITQWMIDDFEAFVDDVESLCEDEYDLVLIYENDSDDQSHYYSYLVKDDDGHVILKLRISLRISNHPPKRGSGQQQKKREEQKAAEDWVRLNTEEKVKKMSKHTVLLTVNDEQFDSYQEAFYRADQLIERAVEVAKQKAKYNKK